MTESPHDPAPDADPRLRVWLREANEKNDSHGSDNAEPLARVRRTLLGQLVAANSPPVPSAGFLARHRFAVGGLAASLALAAGLLIALSSGVQLSAMERMAKKLEQVTSYHCRATGTNTGIDDNGKRVMIKDQEIVSWLAPGAYYQDTKIFKTVEDADRGNRTEEVLADFEEALPLGKPGAFIDHRYKTFCRMLYEPSDEPIGSKTYPWDWLRLIRQGSYNVVRDLGTKRIGDANVHGFRLRLKNQGDKKNAIEDPVELWVDTQTNLPVDISWSGESEGWKHTDHTSDFQWNVAIDPQRFEAVLPPGYDDITPPSNPKELDQIAAALRLYSQLSGGHYPQTRKIDPAAVLAEMLKMVDSATPPHSDAERDKLRYEIDRALPGLNSIARTLRNRYVSGYRGLTVGPADKDQVLIWMPSDQGFRVFRVFYGDLRTETVSETDWSKLVPASDVVDYQKLE